MQLNNTKPKNKASLSFRENRKNRLLGLTIVPLFTVLMIVSAKIVIPVPVIPITLQVTVAIMSGLLLGAKLGFMSQILYLFMGLMGLPVFARGGGIGYVVTGSFGYLVGFAFCALVGGILADILDRRTNGVRVSYVRILFISFTALTVCYMFGITYLYFLSNFYTGFAGTKYSLMTTLAYGALPFIGKDILLCVLAAELTRRLWRFRFRAGSVRNSGYEEMTSAEAAEAIQTVSGPADAAEN